MILALHKNARTVIPQPVRGFSSRIFSSRKVLHEEVEVHG